MSDTWNKLPKAEKDRILFATTEYLEKCIRAEDFIGYITLFDNLCQIIHEGHEPDEQATSLLLHPIRKWGSMYGMVLHEMREEKWDKWRAQKEAKRIAAIPETKPGEDPF